MRVYIHVKVKFSRLLDSEFKYNHFDVRPTINPIHKKSDSSWFINTFFGSYTHFIVEIWDRPSIFVMHTNYKEDGLRSVGFELHQNQKF